MSKFDQNRQDVFRESVIHVGAEGLLAVSSTRPVGFGSRGLRH